MVPRTPQTRMQESGVPLPQRKGLRAIVPQPEQTTYLPLSVEGQVDRLIRDAVSEENLSAMYIGWLPMI